MMDVKTLSGAAGLYREGPHARSNRRGAPVAERARKVQRHLVDPVLAALQAWDPVVGLVVGSYQGCSEGLHALAREVAEERVRNERSGERQRD